MGSLGALRATSYNGLRNAAKANGRDETIFDYLTEEKDPSGFKYRIPFKTQVELFRFAVDHLKSNIKPALCKEDRALWKALGMKFDGCHCLLGRNDAIETSRHPAHHWRGAGCRMAWSRFFRRFERSETASSLRVFCAERSLCFLLATRHSSLDCAPRDGHGGLQQSLPARNAAPSRHNKIVTKHELG